MLENIRLAFQGIWSHKLRSILTMLGIIIGIAAIITIVSTIKGTNDQIKENLIGAGNNVVTVNLNQNGYPYDMSWSSLEKFNYTDYSFEKEGKTTYLREYEIEGTSLVLRVGGPSLTSSPDYVRLIDYFNGESVDDIRKESITAFIEKYQ